MAMNGKKRDSERKEQVTSKENQTARNLTRTKRNTDVICSRTSVKNETRDTKGKDDVRNR